MDQPCLHTPHDLVVHISVNGERERASPTPLLGTPLVVNALTSNYPITTPEASVTDYSVLLTRTCEHPPAGADAPTEHAMSPFFPSFRSLFRLHWVLHVFRTSTRRRCERGAGSSRSTSQLSTRVIASIAVALSALRTRNSSMTLSIRWWSMSIKPPGWLSSVQST